MPLSKARQAEWMRQYRKRQKSVIPSVIPKVPEWQLNPNQYLKGHLAVYPEYLDRLNAGTYDPELDPYINPLMRPMVRDRGIFYSQPVT